MKISALFLPRLTVFHLRSWVSLKHNNIFFQPTINCKGIFGKRVKHTWLYFTKSAGTLSFVVLPLPASRLSAFSFNGHLLFCHPAVWELCISKWMGWLLSSSCHLAQSFHYLVVLVCLFLIDLQLLDSSFYPSCLGALTLSCQLWIAFPFDSANQISLPVLNCCAPEVQAWH